MARYADIDKFLHIVPVDELGNTDFITIEKCLTQASADVAPRAELAKEIFAEIEKIRFAYGFGSDVTNLVVMTKEDFDALKKKYE